MSRLRAPALIAAGLSVVGLAAWGRSHGPEQEGRRLDHVMVTGTMGGFFAFDTETGDIWGYFWENRTLEVTYLGRLEELGKPLELPEAAPGHGKR